MHRLGLVLLALLGSCRTTTSSGPAGMAQHALTRVAARAAWEAWDGPRLLGTVVRFEEDSDPERAFYSVRNRAGQEVGIVDLLGRAWRHRPHQPEAEWLGSGTVLAGARAILEGGEPLRLVEVDLARLREE